MRLRDGLETFDAELHAPPARIDATYDEHAKILKAIARKRGDEASRLLRAHIETSQAEVRKITLHQVHLARQGTVAR